MQAGCFVPGPFFQRKRPDLLPWHDGAYDGSQHQIQHLVQPVYAQFRERIGGGLMRCSATQKSSASAESRLTMPSA